MINPHGAVGVIDVALLMRDTHFLSRPVGVVRAVGDTHRHNLTALMEFAYLAAAAIYFSETHCSITHFNHPLIFLLLPLILQ